MAFDTKDPRFIAAYEFLRRTGVKQVQLRWSDDEQPTVWFAVAVYADGRWDTAAASGPLLALLRLCELLADGATCTHCQRPTGFVPEMQPGAMPLSDIVCWYRYDEGAARYVRGCVA